MTANPHMTTAVDSFQKVGGNFHETLLWHLMHGFVIVDSEFLCIGYYCRNDDLAAPSVFEKSNTAFVTYMTGNLKALKSWVRSGIDFIAFMRGFKNAGRPARCYPIDYLKSHV